MLNILIDNIVYSIQKIGGISLVFYEQTARLLKDTRYQTEFIECEDADENYYRKHLNIPTDKIKSFSRKWLKLLRYINPKPGIKIPYIFHSSYYRVSRDKYAINFTTVHDFTYERSGSKSIATRVHIWQQKQAVLKSDYVICISENTKRDLLHYYPEADASKIHVIYNGVSGEYRKLENINKNNLPFEPQTYCIYVGVRRAYKNYKLAVESLAKTKYNLVIVGSPLSVNERKHLNNTIGEGRYQCFSNVPNDRLNEIYNGAFALLYLSSYEGFGIPCIEAQKAGCPVVALNVSSIPEVVCDEKLLIDVPSIENVIFKLKRLEDRGYRMKIIDKGVRFASYFSWDRTYKELTNLYNKALHATQEDSPR